MNRYLWAALALLILLAASIATILTLDVSHARTKAEIDLALKAVATAATVGSAIFGMLGKRKRSQLRQTSQQARAQFASGMIRTTPPRQEMGEAESLRDYIGQLRTRLIELGGEQARFVALTTLADPAEPATHDDLLPELEWLSRRAGQDFVKAEPERIDLSEVPKRFPRAVLLGEPGSGKSTCLRHLVFTELDRLEAGIERGGLPSSNGDGAGGGVPLYVTLSDWHDPSVSAVDFLRGQLESLVTPSNHFAHNFEELLAAGRFLLVLDGLNELPGRKAHRREGSHEINESDAFQMLRRQGVGSIDTREQSLRDLADKMGLRSRFVLACRSHEYFDSMSWQVVRVVPMNTEQVDRFIDNYVAPPTAIQLRESMQSNPALASIATNPFFLRTITRIYRTGMRLESRGEILTVLLNHVLNRESLKRYDLDDAPDETSNPVLPRIELVRTVGRIAFRMLDDRRVGNQAPLGDLHPSERAPVEELASTGLILERNGEFFFLHQIVQEFLAAAALRFRAVRRRPINLLADSRWSEVVALWYDLDPDSMHRKLVRALRSRNPVWRRPRSGGTPALTVYQFITSVGAVLVAGCYLADLVLGPASALPLLFGWVSVNPLLVLAVVLGVRLPWSFFVWSRRVIPNAAYVLALGQQPAAVAEIIPAFNRLFHLERAQVARHVARFGPAALPHIMSGLCSARWRVRSGCVLALGELAFADPDDPRAPDVLVGIAHVNDPKLMRSLAEALMRCQDERVPQAVTALIDRARDYHPVTTQYRLEPLGAGGPRPRGNWSAEVVGKLDEFTLPDRPASQRQIALRVLGILRLPGSEVRFARIASDDDEIMPVRQAAIAGLGLMQTEESTQQLILLSRMTALRSPVAGAIKGLRDPVTLPVLATAVVTVDWTVRIAIASALGGIGSPAGLAALTRLAEDPDEDVRTVVAHVLGRLESAEAVPGLVALARDPNRGVRTAALKALHQHYLDIAAQELLALAADVTYKDRVRLIRMLGRRAGPRVAEGLRQLTGDLDKKTRRTAQRALERANAQINRRARRQSAWRHPLMAVRGYLSNAFQIDNFRRMWRDERLGETPDNLAFMRLQKRIYEDAELTRRFRTTLRMIALLTIVFYIMVTLLLVLLLRSALLVTDLLLRNWLILILAVVLAILSQIRPIRWYDGPVIFFVLFTIVRWVSRIVIVTVLVGLAISVWWIWALGALIVVATMLLSARRRHATRGRRATIHAVSALNKPAPIRSHSLDPVGDPDPVGDAS